jgi:hypothetical protein
MAENVLIAGSRDADDKCIAKCDACPTQRQRDFPSDRQRHVSSRIAVRWMPVMMSRTLLSLTCMAPDDIGHRRQDFLLTNGGI